MRYPWPESFQSAVVLTFDFDAESSVHFRNPTAARERLGLVEEQRYGVRTGLARILKLLHERSLPASFFVPAFTVREHRAAVESIAEAGHELACHGDVHEALEGLSEADEADLLDRQLTTFNEQLGIRPVGYRAPSWDLNVHTPSLLTRYGFEYDSSLMGDDIPYWVETAEHRLLEIPVQWMLDDAPFYRHVYGAPNQFAEPQRVFDVWSSEFKGLHEQNGCFVLTMHPWISGRPSRLEALSRLIDYMQSFNGVWFATAADVAHWASSQSAEVTSVRLRSTAVGT